MKAVMAVLMILWAGLSPVLAGRANAPAAPAGMTLWTESPANKVQPTSASGSLQPIHLEGARGSSEAYQVIVRAGASPLSGVNLAAGALSGPGGQLIPAAQVTFYREDFINFSGVSAAGGNLPVPANSPSGDSRLPDPLVPLVDPYSGKPAGAPFSVPAGQNQPIWVDLAIPTGAAAGAYSGTITVTASGEAPMAVPLGVTVWDFSLPDMRSVTTHFKLSLNGLIDYHHGIADCAGSNCWLSWNSSARTLVKRYQELAHSHRIDVGEYFVPDPGASGQCAPPNEWSAYDAAMQAYMDGTYWNDQVPSSRLETPFSPGVTWGLETCSQAQYSALAQAWAAHLKLKGWFNQAVVYAYDEPHDVKIYQDIARNAQWMHAGDADWKAHIMDTQEPNGESAPILNPALGIYCVALSRYDNWASDPGANPLQVPYGRDRWPGLFSQGIQLWFYESNAQDAPYPTFATNTLLGAEPQIMMWGAWYESASGFLMWDTTAWNAAAPWGPNVDFAKTGDGVLIYPGNHDGLKAPQGSPAGVAIDGPIPSYRLKMIREGLQDWALFRLAERYGLGSYARAQVVQATGQLGGCTWSGCRPPLNGQFFWKTEAAVMAQVRHTIAQAIAAQAKTMTAYVYLPRVGRR